MTRKEDNTPRNNREKGGNGTKKRVVPKDNSLVLFGALIHFIVPRLSAFRHSLSALSLAPLGPLFSLLRPLTWPLPLTQAVMRYLLPPACSRK